MPRRANQALALGVLVALAATFFALDAGQYVRLEFIKAQQAALEEHVRADPWRAAAIYFAVYVGVTGLSLPGATVMTLVGGAVFGLLWGTVLVSFASTIGATLAFLASRFLFGGWVQRRFGRRLAAVNAGIRREGGLYLFALRLVPLFPFFAVNLLMGLTPIRTWTFYWVSQIGMLAGTLVYVNAGTQLAEIESLRGIASPDVLAALALLGVLPLAGKKAVEAARARRAYARWAGARPSRYDRNLVVIGAGSAGLVAAYLGAALGAKVTLVEKHRMGGDCLYTGCVPSKALVKTTRMLARIRRHRDYGIRAASAEPDFADVMERVQRVIRAVEPHDSAERYAQLGVECLRGEARIVSPWEVEVTKRDGTSTRLTTRAMVIAAGARPIVPPIPGLAAMRYVTSESVWDLRELPRRVLVLGGGPIGCELAQCFVRLGARVSQVERLARLLPREDPEASAAVAARFQAEGIQVLAGHHAREFRLEAGEQVLVCEDGKEEKRIGFDLLVCALGRVANTEGYGLESLGIPITEGRVIETNAYLQTAYPNIFACGDVAGPYQFTHMAAHQAWYATVNALFGPFRRLRADYSVVPWATFTDPEVARVGLNEADAKERGIPHEATIYRMSELDRAIAEEEAHGFVKVLTPPGNDRILGATIVGEHAGELIAEYVAAMRHGLGLNDLLRTIHVYPTFAEANKHAAGAWRRAQVTCGQRSLIESFQAWRRGEVGFGAVVSRAFAAARDRGRFYHPGHR